MPIKIMLRTNKDQSPFRDSLTRLITAPQGDSLVLCSGYIWESDPESSEYKVLDDGLLDAIKTGCTDGIVVTVAGKLEEGDWKKRYRNFVSRLKQSRLRVQSFVAPHKNWHAKIAIRIRKDKPIAVLIGSSNLTGPAYRVGWYRWNFESDVLIWQSDPELDRYFRMAGPPQGQMGNLDLVLDPAIPQLSEQEQMQGLYDDVAKDSNLERFLVE